MYTTLEGKQMQVMRLEKLVKLLEDQQDRAQAQRTRLEHRIAQLEVSLREKSRNDSNRYVMKNYLHKPQSSIIGNRLSRAFSCESEQTLLETSAPYRYFSRYVSPTRSSDRPPREFNLNDWYRISSDKEEAFVCEQCQRKVDEKFRSDVIHHVENPRIRRSLYGWLMDSSVLEAFGEPTSHLNEFHDELSSEEDVDCLYEIVNPITVRNNAKNCNRDPRRYREHYCQYRSRLPRRSLHDVSLRCNPIIRTT